MANPIVSSLPAYIEQNKSGLIGKAVLGAKTLEKGINKQLGIKGPTAINLLNTSVTFADGSNCGYTAAGSQTMTQRTITPAVIRVAMEYCSKNLYGKFATNQLRFKAGEDVLPFEQEFTQDVIKHINAELDKSIWMGDTAGSGNLALFDGFIKLMEADSSVIDKAELNATDVYEVVKNNLLAIPAAAIDENTRIFCGPEFLSAYQQKLVDKNLVHFVPGEDYDEVQIPGSKVKLTAVPGLSTALTAKHYLVGCNLKNLYYGTDLEDDKESFVMDYDVRQDNWALIVEFLAGVQYAFGDQIVLSTVAAAI